MRHLMSIVFPRTSAPVPVWLLHILLWAGLLAGGWQLNLVAGLDRWLRSPLPMLHVYWLSLFIALIYLFGWSSIGLWHALRTNATTGLYVQLETTWDEAWRRLRQTYADPQNVPLFLVLGPRSADLHAALECMGAAPVLPGIPAPLQVYTHRDAILLLTGDMSTLGARGRQPAEGPLQHCCQLLQRDRPADRALQGILLIVPVQALDTENEIEQVTACCQVDLQRIRQASGLECPVHVLILGLQDVPDCLARGWFQRFPVAQTSDPVQPAARCKQLIDYSCLEQIPQLVRRQLRFDPASHAQGGLTEILRHNLFLYRFLDAVQRWRGRLFCLLQEGIKNGNEPGRVAGCYFLPSAAGLTRDGTITQHLLVDMLAQQHAISWTRERVSEFQGLRRSTRRGYALLVAAWCGLLTGVGWALVSLNIEK